jgi:hypothetical protein
VGSKLPPAVAWPKLFAKGVVFSLTASNPDGKDAPAAWNRSANQALEADIVQMHESRHLAPRAWWRSFGFNVQEGWREDGFSLAFAKEERAFARTAVLRLAHKYHQAAIYAYMVEDGVLVREVVWIDGSKQSTHGSKQRMGLIKKPPKSALASRHWQPEGSTDASNAEIASPTFAPTGRESSIWISPGEIRDTIGRLWGK